MRRKTFDALAVISGLVLTVVLAVAGGLLLWGHNFVSDQVHTQLAAQKIYFPPAGSAPIKALPATDAKAMAAYGGQLMTNGAQAQTYADHFIAVHLREIGGGQGTADHVAVRCRPPAPRPGRGRDVQQGHWDRLPASTCELSRPVTGLA